MLNILHCHSTFALGGKEARAVMLMNAFGDRARHTIVSSVPEALAARDAIDHTIAVEFPVDAPSLRGRPGIARCRVLVRYMRRFDLVLTYNWGAMDAVLARRMLPAHCPPLVHHEDGFNADEAVRLKRGRTLLRRLALPAADTVIVPSTTLETIAVDQWRQPRRRVRRIANGIAVADYGNGADPVPIAGLQRAPGDIVVGTVAGLRPVKNLPRLVRAALTIPNVRLVIVGDGPARDEIMAAAVAVGAVDRLVMPGFLAEPRRYLAAFDIFALSSDSEQFPIALIEAMAAGLPVAATNVGDIAAMLPAAQRAHVVDRDDDALRRAIVALATQPEQRARLGALNRRMAIERYDAAGMIASYAAAYESALGGLAQLTEDRVYSGN